MLQATFTLASCLAYAPSLAPSVGVSTSRAAVAPRTLSPLAAVAEASAAATAGRLYTGAETPKVAGGVKVGTRRVVVITGASSGLGLSATRAFLNKDKYFVIAAVRDPEKMDAVAKELGLSKSDYVAMKLELASFQSVRDFVRNLKLFLPARPISHLICNAAVYRPTDPTPAFSDDGYEMSVGVNHLGHFLLVQLLLPQLKSAKNPRVCIVGSVTGNSNTIAGSFVKPVADVGQFQGLLNGPGSDMVDGGKFDGAKAYKDAKAMNMMTVLEMHRRFHDETGIVFNSMYPGCIAETNLFREKRQWFRDLFPVFMKTVGAYVAEDEAGERLAQVIDDPQCTKSGVYWSWNGNAKQFGAATNRVEQEDGTVQKYRTGAGGSGGEIFENQFSGMINDPKLSKKMYDYSMDAVKDFL